MCEELLSFLRVQEYASGCISRESGREASNGILCARSYASRAIRRTALKLGESISKTSCVQLINREWANAALCATHTAGQPVAATSGRVGESGVRNLNQFGI